MKTLLALVLALALCGSAQAQCAGSQFSQQQFFSSQFVQPGVIVGAPQVIVGQPFFGSSVFIDNPGFFGTNFGLGVNVGVGRDFGNRGTFAVSGGGGGVFFDRREGLLGNRRTTFTSDGLGNSVFQQNRGLFGGRTTAVTNSGGGGITVQNRSLFGR
jgi:hypothetical protein